MPTGGIKVHRSGRCPRATGGYLGQRREATAKRKGAEKRADHFEPRPFEDLTEQEPA